MTPKARRTLPSVSQSDVRSLYKPSETQAPSSFQTFRVNDRKLPAMSQWFLLGKPSTYLPFCPQAQAFLLFRLDRCCLFQQVHNHHLLLLEFRPPSTMYLRRIEHTTHLFWKQTSRSTGVPRVQTFLSILLFYAHQPVQVLRISRQVSN